MDREGGYVERIELNEKNNWASIYSFLLHIVAPTIKAQADTVPLPAPIIEAFPVEAIAEAIAGELDKDSVNDTITQADLDTMTLIPLPSLGLTGKT